MVKTRLAGKPHFDKLNIRDWQISVALPSQDIIWPNIAKIYSKTARATLKAFLLPWLISSTVVAALLILEIILSEFLPQAAPYLLYVTCSANVLFNFYGVPYLIFDFL